jgi:HPt (histidine-containing phosphotransfer) domain-containing protein
MGERSRSTDLDFGHLAEVTGGDLEFEKEILGEFLAFAVAAASDIKRFFEQRDAQSLGAEAHSLKGSARSVGATALAEYAERLEKAAGEGGIEGLSGAIAGLDEAVAAFAACVREHLGDLAA